MAVIFRSSRPTPSTCSFTVRSSRPPISLASLAYFWFLMILRVLLVCLISVFFWSKWASCPLETLVCLPKSNSALCSFVRVLPEVPWSYALPGGFLGLWMAMRRGYTEENLLVLRGLGVQTSTSSSLYLVPGTTRFIPTTSIQDMFVHEAFKGFEVRYYLSIIVVGEESAHVVFPALLPRRVIVEEVWRGARECLYEPKS